MLCSCRFIFMVSITQGVHRNSNWTGWYPGVPSNLSYSLILWPLSWTLLLCNMVWICKLTSVWPFCLAERLFSKVHNLKIIVWMWWLEVGQRSWDVNCTMGMFGACTWAGSSPKALWINRQKGWWFGNRSGQWSKVAPSHYGWKGAAWMMLGCLHCNLS